MPHLEHSEHITLAWVRVWILLSFRRILVEGGEVEHKAKRRKRRFSSVTHGVPQELLISRGTGHGNKEEVTATLTNGS